MQQSVFNDLFRLSEAYFAANEKPYLRSFYEDEFFDSPSGMLIGPRGCGKTTVMAQRLAAFKKIQDVLFFPVDHARFTSLTLLDVAEYFHSNGGKILAFDEIHKYEGWAKEIKSIRDQIPNLRLFMSGSSAIEITKHSPDLSRRVIKKHLPVLSFREFLALTYQINTDVISLKDVLGKSQEVVAAIREAVESKGKKILPVFKEYLRSGYFPSRLEFPSDSLYFLALEQIMATTVEVDIPAAYPSLTGMSVYKLKRVLAAIASLPPLTTEFKKLAELVEVSDERTLKEYLRCLETAGLIQTISRSGTGLKGLRKPEKIFLDNPNLIHAIASEGMANIGSIREIYFIKALQPSHDIAMHPTADFLVDQKWVFEIGGRGKQQEQIYQQANGYLVLDDIEIATAKQLPLWLFGFFY